jgi:hypothetical protein
MAEHTRSKAGMGGKKSSKKSGKKPHSIHIRRGKSGGFIATHHHQADDGGQAPEPEDHVVPDLQSLQSHIAENMGDQGAAPPPSPDMSQQAGPPQAGGQAPPQGM